MNSFDEELISKYVPCSKQKEALQRLKEGYPVQYIIGNVDFMGYIIDVNEDVLIPRFETEYLVEHLLFYMQKYGFEKNKILDIGTGSGCISIALKKRCEADITAIDISQRAIDVAKSNAGKNEVDINFICEDIKDYNPKEKYNIIVSNPPYIAYNEPVDPKTIYEPQNALFAGDNGLYFYNLILDNCSSFLAKKSIIAFEIGQNQKEAIAKKAQEVFPNANIISLQDLAGKDRYIFIINE